MLKIHNTKHKKIHNIKEHKNYLHKNIFDAKVFCFCFVISFCFVFDLFCGCKKYNLFRCSTAVIPI